MIKKSLREIEKMSQGQSLKAEYKDILIEGGVSTDTRTIEKNQLFVPLIGEFFLMAINLLKKPLKMGGQ